MTIKIRNAENNDIPQLLPLMDQLGYPQALEQFTNRFQEFLRQDGYGIIVAESEKILGALAWSKSLLLISHKTRFHIEAIVVDQSYRNLGVGRLLLNYLEQWVQPWSPCIIDLTSGLRRSPQGVHKFYASLGYHNEGPMAKLYLRKEIS